MDFVLKGLVGRFGRQDKGERPVRLTSQGSLAVAQVEPEYAELARGGRIFAAVTGVSSTFKAPVVAIPSTTATWAVWNGEPDGGASYLILQASAFLASGTAGVGGSLIAAVSLIRHAAQTAYANSILQSLSGGNKDTKAVLANAVTIAGTQPPWIQIAAADWAASTTIGVGLVAPVKGLFLVQPGGLFCLDVLSGVGTTALYGVSVVWAEVEVDVEQ